MKNALYFVLPALAVAFVTWSIFQWGLNPKSVGVMKPSFFSDVREVGVVIYHRFFVEANENQIFLWGVGSAQPEHHLALAGFLEAAESSELSFDKVYVHESLPLDRSLFGDWPVEVVDMLGEYPSLLEELNRHVKAKERVALLAPYTYTSQKVNIDTLAKTIAENVHPVFSVTTLDFALNSSEEQELRPQCRVIQDNVLGDLGCMTLQKSRSIYRKAIDFPKGKWVAMLDRWPKDDMILYLRHNP